MKHEPTVDDDQVAEDPAPTPAPAKRASKASGAPKRPTRGRRNPEELQARILAAATAEFAEHSYSGARIDKISKRAKTVDRMLYYYFGSKERLYQRVLEEAYSKMIDAQRDMVVMDDPVRGMRDLIEHSWRHYIEHPELVRLVLTENLLRTKYLKKSTKIRRTSLPLLHTVQDILTAGQQQGVFRADADAEHVLITMMSLGFFYVSNQFTMSLWLSTDLMDSERQARWLAHIGDVVLGYLTQKN